VVRKHSVELRCSSSPAIRQAHAEAGAKELSPIVSARFLDMPVTLTAYLQFPEHTFRSHLTPILLDLSVGSLKRPASETCLVLMEATRVQTTHVLRFLDFASVPDVRNRGMVPRNRSLHEMAGTLKVRK
jgi:hypothetical protein